MKNSVVAVILGVLPVVATAQSGGIAERNYSIGVGATTSDIGEDYSLFGSARFPLAEYIGIFGSAKVDKFEGKNQYLDATTTTGSLGALLRNSEFGSFEGSYFYGKSNDTLPENVLLIDDSGLLEGDYSTTLHGYSLVGTFFIKRMDVSVKYFDFDAELSFANGGNFKAGEDSFFAFAGSYYFGNSFSLSAHASEQDAAGIIATYQPTVFGNAVGITGRFTVQDRRELYELSLVYHFGNKANLIDRNRRY